MHIQYHLIDGEIHVVRQQQAEKADAIALLFLHGLGESSLCFTEAAAHLPKGKYHLVMPDCIGYGRSSAARNHLYDFAHQIGRLQTLVQTLKLQNVVIVGHSLGGMLGTLWLSEMEHSNILGFINIEGNLFPDDASHSRMATEAYRNADSDFARWHHWFTSVMMEELVLRDHVHSLACRRYYASLHFAQPDAFLANAEEILTRTAITSDQTVPMMAKQYANIQLPKLYLWGTESISKATQQFLMQHEMEHHAFQGAGHWPMIDQPEACYGIIDRWVSKLKN